MIGLLKSNKNIRQRRSTNLRMYVDIVSLWWHQVLTSLMIGNGTVLSEKIPMGVRHALCAFVYVIALWDWFHIKYRLLLISFGERGDGIMPQHFWEMTTLIMYINFYWMFILKNQPAPMSFYLDFTICGNLMFVLSYTASYLFSSVYFEITTLQIINICIY